MMICALPHAASSMQHNAHAACSKPVRGDAHIMQRCTCLLAVVAVLVVAVCGCGQKLTLGSYCCTKISSENVNSRLCQTTKKNE